MKTVALGTSKINYLDPRISVSWCKRNEVHASIMSVSVHLSSRPGCEHAALGATAAAQACRICICEMQVPMEKIFNKSLLSKFHWAMVSALVCWELR